MYLILAIVVVLVLCGDGPGRVRLTLPRALTGTLGIVVACAMLAATFAVSAAVDLRDGEHAVRGIALPFAVIAVNGTSHPFASDVATIAAVLQSLALAILALQPAAAFLRQEAVAVLWTTLGIVVAIALVIPLLRSPDLYAYAGYTLLPQPYATQHVPFDPGDRSIAALWGYPIVPAVYGPLWIFVSKLAAGAFGSLETRLYALRVLSTLAFAACAIVYARLRDRRSALALFALNPLLVNQFVVNGHNDLWAVAFLLLGLLPALGYSARVACLTAAGCVKLPLIVAGAVIFAGYDTLAKRIAGPAIAVVLVIVAALAAQMGIVRTVLAVNGSQVVTPFIVAAHIGAFALCLAVVGVALVWKRLIPFGGLTTIALGPAPFPWYFAWGLPYARAFGDDRPILVALPLLGVLADSSYDATPLRLGVGTLVLAAATGAFAIGRLKRARAPKTVV